jgi:hypothetical protein
MRIFKDVAYLGACWTGRRGQKAISFQPVLFILLANERIMAKEVILATVPPNVLIAILTFSFYSRFTAESPRQQQQEEEKRMEVGSHTRNNEDENPVRAMSNFPTAL